MIPDPEQRCVICALTHREHFLVQHAFRTRSWLVREQRDVDVVPRAADQSNPAMRVTAVKGDGQEHDKRSRLRDARGRFTKDPMVARSAQDDSRQAIGAIHTDLEVAWKYYAAHPAEIEEAIRRNEEA